MHRNLPPGFAARGPPSALRDRHDEGAELLRPLRALLRQRGQDGAEDLRDLLGNPLDLGQDLRHDGLGMQLQRRNRTHGVVHQWQDLLGQHVVNLVTEHRPVGRDDPLHVKSNAIIGGVRKLLHERACKAREVSVLVRRGKECLHEVVLHLIDNVADDVLLHLEERVDLRRKLALGHVRAALPDVSHGLLRAREVGLQRFARARHAVLQRLREGLVLEEPQQFGGHLLVPLVHLAYWHEALHLTEE
mmetsp:Transcript_84144/g.223401  ORF Transcript_84144/g.223401 Transcript_84144/m.223401 type:complete len:246 (+) Transcript_84144:3-740(+)